MHFPIPNIHLHYYFHLQPHPHPQEMTDNQGLELAPLMKNKTTGISGLMYMNTHSPCTLYYTVNCQQGLYSLQYTVL